MSNFSGSDWALIITAATGFFGMLGTQIAQLMVSLKNSRHLDEAKATALETKTVIDAVKTQTDGMVSGAVANALALGTAEGNLAGRAKQTEERRVEAQEKER